MSIVIAHRGASAYEPENTLRAIKRALELNANMIEVDVRLSKDNHIIVIHDDSVDRTTNGKGYVKDLMLEELKKLDAGKGERIPTLQEVINTVRNKAILIIEIKVLNIEDSVVKMIEKEGIEKEAIITSFYHPILRRIKELNPMIKTGVIFKCHPVKSAELALNAHANSLFPEHKYILKEMVKEAHKHDLEIYPWTIDDLDRANQLIEMDVDGIVTNKPDILKMKN
ncbi:MAG: glycerophosphodiester phosphodiesterase [archaeon]|nr:glycerophosphodiester phosphodiesterase [archaeon]MCP8315661.1 glycerophosphodiester phosphodiesterase [archaeon]MCP8320403.1 glycerophosphodiester phosphodiesterase [archaeon]